MAKVNRLKVVLAEKKKTGKWIASLYEVSNNVF